MPDKPNAIAFDEALFVDWFAAMADHPEWRVGQALYNVLRDRIDVSAIPSQLDPFNTCAPVGVLIEWLRIGGIPHE